MKQYSINTGAVITTAALGLLCFSSLSPHSTLLSDEWLGLAATIRKYVGGWLIIRISWGIVIVFHSLEATYRTCVRLAGKAGADGGVDDRRVFAQPAYRLVASQGKLHLSKQL